MRWLLLFKRSGSCRPIRYSTPCTLSTEVPLEPSYRVFCPIKISLSLPEVQKAAFKLPADEDEMCSDMIIQAQERKKCFTRLLELVRPLIGPLKRFEGAIDIIVQTHDGIANLIWDPFRMVITVASDFFKTSESLIMIL